MRHIYSASSLYPTRHVAASAWVIRKLSRMGRTRALASTYRQCCARQEETGVIEKGVRLVLSSAAVTFANCARARGKNLSGEARRPRVLFFSAGIYLRLYGGPPYSSIFPTSIIIFHDARLENSQIYERTSGQINMPCGCAGAPLAFAEFTSDRMRNGPEASPPFAPGSASFQLTTRSLSSPRRGKCVSTVDQSIDIDGLAKLIPFRRGLVPVVLLPRSFDFSESFRLYSTR